MSDKTYDVVIIGGGVAGLSAALVLGRCLRQVLVCDHGRPRNRSSKHLHGFLTRDGESPMEMLAIAREQLQRYETVLFNESRVIDAVSLSSRKDDGRGFEITLDTGDIKQSKNILISTGIVDELPEIPGFNECYGKCVFHCPYCDAFELQGRPLAIYGRGESVYSLALMLYHWSKDLAIISNGKSNLSKEQLDATSKRNIKVYEKSITALENTDGRLKQIHFADGSRLQRTGIFFSAGSFQHTDIPKLLGCNLNENGGIKTSKFMSTNIPGVYAAGDAMKEVQLAIMAAAEGAMAAVAINKGFHKEDLP